MFKFEKLPMIDEYLETNEIECEICKKIFANSLNVSTITTCPECHDKELSRLKELERAYWAYSCNSLCQHGYCQICSIGDKSHIINQYDEAIKELNGEPFKTPKDMKVLEEFWKMKLDTPPYRIRSF